MIIKEEPKKLKELKELLGRRESEQYELAIFGSGRYGKATYVILQEYGVEVNFFIDNDARKNGKEIIGGIKCTLPNTRNENVVCVIAVNDIYVDEVYHQAVELGFASVICFYNSDLDQLFSIFDDETCIRRVFKAIYKRDINLEHPETFNEKLNWLKLHDRRPEYTTMTDKYAAREYISNVIGGGYSVPLVGGPWKSFDEINFDNLPDQFVLKCTHDSGSVFICKDKSKFDIEAVREKVNRKLKANFYWLLREWAYKDITPRIIAEQYLQGDLTDYRFFCFNGDPKVAWIELERQNTPLPFFKSPEGYYFSVDEWKPLDFTTAYEADENASKVSRPKCLPEMLDIARKLSKNLAQARIDLYEVGGRVYFSEITLYHYGGFAKFSSAEWEKRLGNWIDLSKV